MAFRTNKMPVLQSKTASGAVATFDTALAMPLVNGEFTIQAYQEGSGDPSPSNIRNIIGYSAVNITHNGAQYTKQLGETVYGGSYNIDGTKRKTYEKVVFDGSIDENWLGYTAGNGWQILPPNMKTGTFSYDDNVMCNILKKQNVNNTLGIRVGYNNNYIQLCQLNSILSEPTLQGLKDWLSENNLVVTIPLAEPIETDIGATPISTIIGNNTIFADTGDVDLTFKDLDIAKRGNFREVFKLPS